MTECVCLCVCSVHFDSPETTIRRIFIYSLFMKPFVFKPPPRCYVRKRLYGKYKGTENHNQNTDLTLNNAREKKKKHSTIRTRRRWRRWCVPYKFRINVKKYAHGNRAEFYLCYIILCFFFATCSHARYCFVVRRLMWCLPKSWRSSEREPHVEQGNTIEHEEIV